MKSTAAGDADLHDDEGNGAEANGNKPVASVQRAMLVMDAFLQANGTLSLAQLSGLTGLYKSTIARILRTLELQDYVVRTRNSDFYVGPALLRLATRFQHAVQPEEIVVPVLRALVARTNESVSYLVPFQKDRIILYRVHSSHALRDHGLAGDVVPLDRGAAGHVFRAFQGNNPRDARVREQLLAVSRGEIEIGMTGMASPVFDRSRECVGAIALSGPATRFTPEAMAAWTPFLLEAAQALTTKLGGNGRLYNGALAVQET